MKRSLNLVVPAILFALAAPTAGAEGVKIGNKIPFADGVGRDAIRKECDLESQLSAFLSEFGGSQVESTGDLKDAKGKVFDAKITGVWAAGGPWGAASILVEGELRDSGKVIGTVAARRNTSRGGGACGKLAVSARAVAKDIAGWLDAPSMGARLGDAGK